MTFFYELNQKLNSIGTESTQLTESKKPASSPVRQVLETTLEQDLKKLWEDGTGGANFSGSGSLEEKWAGGATLNPEKKGMFKGKTKADLEKQLAALHKTGPHKKGTPEYTKQQELNFAIRAKSGWKKGVNEAMEDDPSAFALMLRGIKDPARRKTAIGKLSFDQLLRQMWHIHSTNPFRGSNDGSDGAYAHEEGERDMMDALWKKAAAMTDDEIKQRIADIRAGMQTSANKNPTFIQQRGLNVLTTELKRRHISMLVSKEAVNEAMEDEDDFELPTKLGKAKTNPSAYQAMLDRRAEKEAERGFDDFDFGNEPRHSAKTVRSVTFNRPDTDLDDLDEAIPMTLEGSMKNQMMADAEHMSLQQFCEKYGDEAWVKEFYHNTVGVMDSDTMDEDQHMMEYLRRKAQRENAHMVAVNDMSPAHAGIEFEEDGPHGKPQWLIDAQKRAERRQGKEVDESMMLSDPLEAIDHLLDKLDKLVHDLPVSSEERRQLSSYIYKFYAEAERAMVNSVEECGIMYESKRSSAYIRKTDKSKLSEHDDDDMTKNQIHTIRRAARALESIVRADEEVPEWVKSKITIANDYLKTVRDYLESAMERSVERATGREGVTSTLDEKITKKTSAGEIISDFEKSKNPKFAGKSKAERKKQALGAFYGMHPEKSKNEDAKKDDKAERAGKRVAKDIEYDEKVKDRIHGKKRDSEDDKAEHAGKRVAKDIEYDDKKKTKKVKETTTAGSVAPAAAKSTKGSPTVGKGIYDSINRQVESMISESIDVDMSKNFSDEGEETSTIKISANGAEADMLKDLLKNAGIDVHSDQRDMAQDYQDEEGTFELELDEADVDVSENNPDYPTNNEFSDDALQYSGGLNGRKSTGQTTVPVISSQDTRQMSEERSMFDLYKAIAERT